MITRSMPRRKGEQLLITPPPLFIKEKKNKKQLANHDDNDMNGNSDLTKAINKLSISNGTSKFDHQLICNGTEINSNEFTTNQSVTNHHTQQFTSKIEGDSCSSLNGFIHEESSTKDDSHSLVILHNSSDESTGSSLKSRDLNYLNSDTSENDSYSHQQMPEFINNDQHENNDEDPFQPPTLSDEGTSVQTSALPNNTSLMIALLQRTGYTMIQENGQRKYGGPPPGWGAETEAPGRGCEIFVGKIPRDLYEDELVPLFETAGPLYELRLMMDFSGANRGYAFVMYTTKEDARNAIRKFNNYEIRRGKPLGVCPSVDNCRLFVGAIPRDKSDAEIQEALSAITEGVTNVILYPSAEEKTRNRGYAFVEYDCHKSAAMARRKLVPGKIQLWGKPIIVDWAEPEVDVDDEILETVKILYVRNLMLTTSEETIKKFFTDSCNGDPEVIERVKKIKDYAFVHFARREDALCAMEATNGINLEGSIIEVSLAKPIDQSYYNQYSPKPRVMTHMNTSSVGGMIARNDSLPYVITTPSLPFSFVESRAKVSYNRSPLPNSATGFSPITFFNPTSSPSLSCNSLNSMFNNFSSGSGYDQTTPKTMVPLRAMRGAGGLRGNPLRLRGYRPQREKKLYELREKNNMVYGVSKQGDFLSEKNIQVLDELCKNLGWHVPEYRIESVRKLDCSRKEVHLFSGKVRIYDLNQEFVAATQMGLTSIEAKIYAADHMLNILKIYLGSQNTVTDTKNFEGDPLYKSQDRFSSKGMYKFLGTEASYMNSGFVGEKILYHTPQTPLMSPVGPWNDIGQLFQVGPLETGAQNYTRQYNGRGGFLQTIHPVSHTPFPDSLPSPTSPNSYPGSPTAAGNDKNNNVGYLHYVNGAFHHTIPNTTMATYSELYSPTSPPYDFNGNFLNAYQQQIVGESNYKTPIMMINGVSAAEGNHYNSKLGSTTD